MSRRKAKGSENIFERKLCQKTLHLDEEEEGGGDKSKIKFNVAEAQTKTSETFIMKNPKIRRKIAFV